jgi:hypothetical protein
MNRLRAMQGQGETGVIKLAASYTRGRMILNMIAVGARKTGLTAGSLQPIILGPTKAVIMGSPVAVWIDSGTGLYGPKHHVITPLAKKALAFTVGGRRLSGRGGGTKVVVRSVKGMKARPYINLSVIEASQKVGSQIGAQIITAWNGA